MKVKKNDTVLVLTGKDAGSTAKVLTALPKANKVIVEGINMISKHTKPSLSLSLPAITLTVSPFLIFNDAIVVASL